MLWDSVTWCGLAPSQEPKLKLVNGAMCCIQYSTLKKPILSLLSEDLKVMSADRLQQTLLLSSCCKTDLHISPQSDFSL